MGIAFYPSGPAVSQRMSRQKTRDTAIEVAVRRILYATGLRYRVHFPIPGIPRRSIDIAFPGQRLAVFIDGCFWHGCHLHRNIPATNRTAWELKIGVNQERDRHSDQHLTGAGWTVLRFWEHVTPGDIAAEIIVTLRERTPLAHPPVAREG
jgi:DNA mismatch endonuclease (patch repair protein)